MLITGKCCFDGDPPNQPRCIKSHSYPPGVPFPRRMGGLPGSFLAFPAEELQLFTFEELAEQTFESLVIEIPKRQAARNASGVTPDPNGPIWVIREHNIVVYKTREEYNKVYTPVTTIATTTVAVVPTTTIASIVPATTIEAVAAAMPSIAPADTGNQTASQPPAGNGVVGNPSQ